VFYFSGLVSLKFVVWKQLHSIDPRKHGTELVKIQYVHKILRHTIQLYNIAEKEIHYKGMNHLYSCIIHSYFSILQYV
jgi:hypothetical protein